MSNGNVNKIILVGHLGQNPDLRYTAKGNPVITLSLATNKEFKTADGLKKAETQWHRATLWGKKAETCAKYLTKGSRIYLEGELQMKSWTDKEGSVKKSAEILVDEIKFLGGSHRSEIAANSESPVEAVTP